MELVERKFEPSLPASSRWLYVAGILGSAALGAGVFGLWFADVPVAGAGALALGGLGALLLSFVASPGRVPTARVGQEGVALGEGGDELRLPWCDVRRVCIKGQRLIVEGDATSLSLPLPAHAAAASRVVAEAATRIGDRVDVSPADHERLPRPSDDDSTRVPAPRLQLAGRKCAASGKSITFETDARRCDNCGALYHVAHVPESCVCCGQSLGAREGDARAATRAG